MFVTSILHIIKIFFLIFGGYISNQAKLMPTTGKWRFITPEVKLLIIYARNFGQTVPVFHKPMESNFPSCGIITENH
jgi:hypothetical protein